MNRKVLGVRLWVTLPILIAAIIAFFPWWGCILRPQIRGCDWRDHAQDR